MTSTRSAPHSTALISADPGRAVPGDERRYVDDVPDTVVAQLRGVCLALPDAHEEKAWAGWRWMVRRKTFAHVLGIEFADEPGRGVQVVLVFRSAGEELEMLRHAGPPFHVLGWGRDALGLSIDGETDWVEVVELVTESFCVMAPKKLAALVDRPPEPDV